jgi:hypothetical protein
MVLKDVFRNITIYCGCGAKLVRYRKRGKGRLVKIHRLRISEDYYGIFSNDALPEGSDILCPECNERIATVRMVNGKWVHKVNQGQIGLIRKS